MQSFLLREKTKRSFLDCILSLKYSTRENYPAALNRFERFCNSTYGGRNGEDIIRELKSIPQEDRDEAYFGVLQDFVNWLLGLGLTSTTVNMYFQIVTYYFSYHGIRAHYIDIRRNVKRPKKIKEKLSLYLKVERELRI